MDHENQELSPTVSQSGEPREVVLRYEAPVTPIVERYVQPTPLPGQPKKHTSPRKKRKGLKIFLFCMLGLLLVSGVVTALWLGGAFDDHRSYHDNDFEQRHDEDYYDMRDAFHMYYMDIKGNTVERMTEDELAAVHKKYWGY